MSYNSLHLYINLALNITSNKAVSIAVILRWWLSSLPRSLKIAILRAEHEISANAAAGLGAVVITVRSQKLILSATKQSIFRTHHSVAHSNIFFFFALVQ